MRTHPLTDAIDLALHAPVHRFREAYPRPVLVIVGVRAGELSAPRPGGVSTQPLPGPTRAMGRARRPSHRFAERVRSASPRSAAPDRTTLVHEGPPPSPEPSGHDGAADDGLGRLRVLPIARSPDAPATADGPLLLGRYQPADLILSDFTVSRRHAQLSVRHDSLTLRIMDLGSTNGTWVRGEPIPPHQWVEVPSGTRLDVGRMQCLAFAPVAFHRWLKLTLQFGLGPTQAA